MRSFPSSSCRDSRHGTDSHYRPGQELFLSWLQKRARTLSCKGSKFGAYLDSSKVSKALVSGNLDKILSLVVIIISIFESKTGKLVRGSFDCILEFAAYCHDMVESS